MQIPVKEKQVAPIAPNVAPAQIAPPPKEAGGADIYQSTSALGGETQQLGSMIARRQQQIQAAQEEADLNARAQKYIAGVGLYLNDEDLDDNGLPKGALHKNGNNVKGITTGFVGYKDGELTDEVMDGLSAGLQKKLAQKLAPFRQQTINSLSVHEAGQTKKAISDSNDLMTSQLVDAAAKGAPLDEIFAAMAPISQSNARLNGSDEKMWGEYEKADRAKVLSAVVGVRLENGDVETARAELEKYKDAISAPIYEKLNSEVEGKENFLFADQLVASAGKDANGLVNMTALNNQIENNKQFKGMEPERRQKIYDFAQGKAGEINQRYLQRRNSADRSFLNNAWKMFEDGKSMEEILPLAKKHGWDRWDIEGKEDIIRGWFKSKAEGAENAEPSLEQLEAYYSLREQQLAGNISEADIFRAEQEGMIVRRQTKTLMDTQSKENLGIRGATLAQAKAFSRRIEEKLFDIDGGNSLGAKARREKIRSRILSDIAGKSLKEASDYLQKALDEPLFGDAMAEIWADKAEQKLLDPQKEMDERKWRTLYGGK